MAFPVRLVEVQVCSVNAPGGTVRLPSAENSLEDNLLAAMLAGSIFLDLTVSYNTTAKTWTDRKSGIVFFTGSGTMPVLTPAGQNGKSYLQWGAGNVLASSVDARNWPPGGDWAAVAILASSGGANGGIIGSGRI